MSLIGRLSLEARVGVSVWARVHISSSVGLFIPSIGRIKFHKIDNHIQEKKGHVIHVNKLIPYGLIVLVLIMTFALQGRHDESVSPQDTIALLQFELMQARFDLETEKIERFLQEDWQSKNPCGLKEEDFNDFHSWNFNLREGSRALAAELNEGFLLELGGGSVANTMDVFIGGVEQRWSSFFIPFDYNFSAFRIEGFSRKGTHAFSYTGEELRAAILDIVGDQSQLVGKRVRVPIARNKDELSLWAFKVDPQRFGELFIAVEDMRMYPRLAEYFAVADESRAQQEK